jgi:hypothetical protein
MFNSYSLSCIDDAAAFIERLIEDVQHANKDNLPNIKIERLIKQLSMLQQVTTELSDSLDQIKYERTMAEFRCNSEQKLELWKESLKN